MRDWHPDACNRLFFIGICGTFLLLAARGEGAGVFIGAATESITPDRPVAIAGQMHTRISAGVESPVVAAALALESRDGDNSLDQAILVACDLVYIPQAALAKTRERLQASCPDFPVEKLILSATHTHTAPVLTEGQYEIPREGVMQVSEYLDFLAERVALAAAKAWQSRRPGKVGWGLGHAVVAYNRRSVYADGTAVMYGGTREPHFRMIEGYEDHTVDVLCCWDADEKLIATAINVACPSQEVEGRSAINADFWHPVRESLQERFGPEFCVLGWNGASGDQSPHVMFYQRAEERMQRLRGLDRLREISRRIVAAWDEAYAGAKQERHADALLAHRVEPLELPRREVTEREYELAKAKVEEYKLEPGKRTLIGWHGAVVERYERQQAGTVEPFVMELHVLRLGDVAIATNQFELYTDYGVQLKARSPALQTFVLQLAGPGSYLPTERAVRGGGYSAIAESNEVSPAGGQVLVDRTLERLHSLWPEAAK